MPKVSIIVPVYNVEKYISYCLDSILNQTMQDFEIIVVNDGTKDNSEEIINKYKQKYKDKIQYYKKENTGLSDTRNFAVSKSNGEYLMFVDSDDYIQVDLLEQLEPYINDKIDLIKFKLNTVDEQHRIIEKINGPVFDKINGEEAFNKLCKEDTMLEVACVYLYKREFYIQNNFRFEKGLYHEDFGLIPLVIVKAKHVVSTNIFGYNYLQTANSITRNQDYNKTKKRANDILKHYDNMQNKIKEFNILTNTKDSIKKYYSNAVLAQTNKLNKEDKKQYKLEIKKRKILRNIKVTNVKQLIKRVILELYYLR